MVWVLTYCTELWGQWLVDWSCCLLLGPGIPFLKRDDGGWLLSNLSTIKKRLDFLDGFNTKLQLFCTGVVVFLYFLFVNLCSPRMKAWKMRPWKKTLPQKWRIAEGYATSTTNLKPLDFPCSRRKHIAITYVCLMLSPLVFHRPWKIVLGEINKVGSYSTSYKWGYSSYK